LSYANLRITSNNPAWTWFLRFTGCEHLILINLSSVSKEFRFYINKWHEYLKKIKQPGCIMTNHTIQELNSALRSAK
jgi:hypothetical protein